MLSSWDRAGRPSVRATTTTTRMSCECGATHDGARRNACAVSKSSRKGEWQHTRSIDTHAATQRPRERGWRGAMAAAATDEMPAMAGKRRYAGGCHRGSGGTVRSGLLMAHQGMASKMVCACVWIWRGVKTGPPDPPKCAARHRLSGPGVLHVERAQHPPPPPRRPRRCIHTDTHTHTRERWRRRTHTHPQPLPPPPPPDEEALGKWRPPRRPHGTAVGKWQRHTHRQPKLPRRLWRWPRAARWLHRAAGGTVAWPGCPP